MDCILVFIIYMGEVFNDDSILEIVLKGLTDEYLQIKYSAEQSR